MLSPFKEIKVMIGNRHRRAHASVGYRVKRAAAKGPESEARSLYYKLFR